MEQCAFSERELWCRQAGKKIYGRAFIPDKKGKLPIVIFAHELGRNHMVGIPYARALASVGFAVYVFDFCGGTVGVENRSDGSNLDMSVVTESEDINAVLTEASRWDFVDPSRISLLGASQGGIAAMLAASQRPSDVARLVMMYPPLVIADSARMKFGTRDAIPDSFDMFGGWIRVGRRYAEDMWDLDFYEPLSSYPGDILLLHGDNDHTAKLSFSVRAAEVIPHCEFHIIPGAGHHFSGPQFEEAMSYILRFLSPLLLCI